MSCPPWCSSSEQRKSVTRSLQSHGWSHWWFGCSGAGGGRVQSSRPDSATLMVLRLAWAPWDTLPKAITRDRRWHTAKKPLMHEQVRIQHSCLKVVGLHIPETSGCKVRGTETRDLWDMLRGRETRISCLNKNGELQIQWKTLTQGNKVGSVRDKVQCPPLATACTCKHTSIRIKGGRKRKRRSWGKGRKRMRKRRTWGPGEGVPSDPICPHHTLKRPWKTPCSSYGFEIHTLATKGY